MTSEEVYVRSKAELRDWLAHNYARPEGIWLVFNKGESRTIQTREIVEELLCFGWIDGRAGSVDITKTKLYISPRRPNSKWSKVNKNIVAQIINSDRMTPAGLKVINAAKQSGTWNALDGVENIKIPPDLKKEFKNNPGSAENFDAFPRSAKKVILEWILTAKRPDTRAKRVIETAQSAAKNIRSRTL